MHPDLRHALRLLLRAPGFTALAVGTLALGIAASTAIFSLADAVVLAPLPYADPAGDPRVIGRLLELDGVPHEVVGVMPPGFALPTDFTEDAAEPTQIYVPRAPDQDDLTQFGNHGDYGAAQLAPGATPARATEELRAAFLSRFLASLLHDVRPLDPSTYLAVAVALASVALVAGLVPALRAARTDPAIALRNE